MSATRWHRGPIQVPAEIGDVVLYVPSDDLVLVQLAGRPDQELWLYDHQLNAYIREEATA